MFLDLDGTLAEIAERPQDARLVPGTLEALERMVHRVELVAIVSGRRPDELGALVDVPGVRLIPLYGLAGGAPVPDRVLDSVADLAEATAGLRLEAKVESLAVHARGAADPAGALGAVEVRLRAIAEEAGFELLRGKQVIELVPQGRPRKGAAVARETEREQLDAVLYAGDDLADLDVFDALDRIASTGIETLRLTVDGPETPAELLARADLVVDSPSELVRILEAV